MYRYNFFNDKCYSENHTFYTPDWSNEFSLRKHESSVRALFGYRRRFSPADKKGALTLEASTGIGLGMRFGRFDIAGSRDRNCAALGAPGTMPPPAGTEYFDTPFIALPVNVKVGYSWGQ